jgi:hypothetical protein
MANDPNTIQYVIQEDGFWYVASKDRTPGVPEITVSSKGVANGLSEEYNDGWDFGPDSYDPTSTSAIPYTQTVGIMEAINYSYANNVNTIKLMDGVYDVSSAPFVNGGYSYYYQIILPSIPNTSTQFNLSIIGNSSSRGGIEGGMPLNDYKGGVTIRSTATAPSGSTSSILGCPTASDTSTNLSQLNLYLDGIHFQTSPTGSLGGFNLDFCVGVIIGKLYVDIDSSDIFPTTISSAAGAIIGNTLNSSIFYAEEISVVGYTTGVYITSASHMYISKIMTDMCVNGLFVLGSTYGAYVGVYDFQNCQIGIVYQNSANNAYLKIGLISMGDQQTSGYPYDFQYAVQDNGGGGTHVLIATLLAAQTYTPAVVTTANSVFKIQFLDLMPTASITANPPVSGTVYQNTNPYDIEIDLPVYATTAGTAGYVTVAKGATSTPSAIGNQYVSGDTSSTSTQIIRLRVPAGWYYEFTASGVTFGTASVFAD